MTSRRDWQLQQLGITQWSLRRPGALQGELFENIIGKYIANLETNIFFIYIFLIASSLSR